MPQRIAEARDKNVCWSSAPPVWDAVDDIVSSVSRDVIEVPQRSRPVIRVWRFPISRTDISSGCEVLLVICATGPGKKPIRPVRLAHVNAKRDVAWPIIPAVGVSPGVHILEAGGDVWRSAH